MAGERLQTDHQEGMMTESPVASSSSPSTMCDDSTADATSDTPPSSRHSSDTEHDLISIPEAHGPQLENVLEQMNISALPLAEFRKQRKRRASTKLISQSGDDIRRLIGEDETGTKLIEKVCCGGGCCLLEKAVPNLATNDSEWIEVPANPAFRSLNLKLGSLSMSSALTNVMPLTAETISIATVPSSSPPWVSRVSCHPPAFVTPHPPYEVFSAKLHHARELTKEGAEKKTYHFDLDVTDYPEESGEVDFTVGGAVGVCASNSTEIVEELLDLLCVPRSLRDKQILLRTTTGRWPTIWGEERPRELFTTRRELLTWCSDLQSYPPTKSLLRLLANYATAPNENKILTYLVSAQGQAAFCDLRTGSHLTINQLLHAFPSSVPPLTHLLSNLQQLMPRFYSLSADPYVSCTAPDSSPSISSSILNRLPTRPRCHRLIEIAVTVSASTDYLSRPTRGIGSGFLERCAQRFLNDPSADIRIPLFRGLMSNPLAKEFISDGPLLLIGAGVGVAPFRGFVQRRLRNANCANKVWVLQGVRDSLKDELYSGEWGENEKEVKKVVESRKPGGEGRYVQEEVVHQADLVWRIINALDGRVFVCGSGKGMGEGVEQALVEVAQRKGGLNHEGAEKFWADKKTGGQYIVETW